MMTGKTVSWYEVNWIPGEKGISVGFYIARQLSKTVVVSTTRIHSRSRRKAALWYVDVVVLQERQAAF